MILSLRSLGFCRFYSLCFCLYAPGGTQGTGDDASLTQMVGENLPDEDGSDLSLEDLGLKDLARAVSQAQGGLSKQIGTGSQSSTEPAKKKPRARRWVEEEQQANDEQKTQDASPEKPAKKKPRVQKGVEEERQANDEQESQDEFEFPEPTKKKRRTNTQPCCEPRKLNDVPPVTPAVKTKALTKNQKVQALLEQDAPATPRKAATPQDEDSCKAGGFASDDDAAPGLHL